MEETPVDRQARAVKAWLVALVIGYCALVVYWLANPGTRIFGIFNVPVAAYFIARFVVKSAFDDAPQLWRRLAYRGWHGKYRAFDDRRVRVLDGERDAPSQVFAADIFGILGQDPSQTELAKLAARYGEGFVQGAEGETEGEWLFADEACMAYVRGFLDNSRSARGRTANRLALWLERSVFMPIDNRRSAATGKTYAFTRQASRR